MLSWLRNDKKGEGSTGFAPRITINPKSTLHVQVEPNDPHTAANIVITAFSSK